MSSPEPLRSSMTADFDLSVLSIPHRGAIYDLATGWWPGMPVSAAHPQFQLLTYRTPRGQRAQRDISMLADNDVNFHFISELVMTSMHSGTHIDALSHVTVGPRDSWHDGSSADTHLGDFGPLSEDAASLPPLIGRGLLLDVPAALGVEQLPASYAIDIEDLERARDHAGCPLRPGDVVLIRTGIMQAWPNEDELARLDGAGINDQAATWLLSFRPSAVGSDNRGLEVAPSELPGDPSPIHRILLYEAGVPILEWVNLEGLAADGVYEFLFCCLPLTIRGATGSLVRPVAIG